MQPTSGYNYTSISGGVGTAVVKDKNAYLKRVVVPGTFVGTLNLHDAPSAAGTTSTSQVLSLGLPTTSIPQSLEMDIQFKNGLVYQATGTPVVTLVWN